MLCQNILISKIKVCDCQHPEEKICKKEEHRCSQLAGGFAVTCLVIQLVPSLSWSELWQNSICCALNTSGRFGDEKASIFGISSDHWLDQEQAKIICPSKTNPSEPKQCSAWSPQPSLLTQNNAHLLHLFSANSCTLALLTAAGGSEGCPDNLHHCQCYNAIMPPSPPPSFRLFLHIIWNLFLDFCFFYKSWGFQSFRGSLT